MAVVPNQMLSEMLNSLRAECGHSLNVAHGLNERASLVYLLDRVQRDLWEDYDWPDLIVDRDVVLAQGQRYYPFPDDLQFDDIEKAWIIFGSVVGELTYGITPDDFIIYNSISGQTSWPPQKWQYNVDQGAPAFELWPIPDSNAANLNPTATLRFRGTQSAQPLINDSDFATLPWRIIVLTAAAELLAKEEDPAAQSKAQRASELIRRLKVRRGSHKNKVFVMGGGCGGPAPRIGLDYIPSGYGSGPSRR